MSAELDDALEGLKQAIDEQPERDAIAAMLAAERGETYPHPVLRIGHPPEVETDKHRDKEAHRQRAEQTQACSVASLAGEIRDCLAPLKLLNPFNKALSLGVGPGTLAANFGCELDPHTSYCPATHVALDDLLAAGCPDPATSGLMPVMKQRIDFIKAHTPEWLKIDTCDMQGPFNIAHMVLGDEAFLAPYERPDDFREAMSIVTELFMGVRDRMIAWIGPERLPPLTSHLNRIAECSVNLTSRGFYLDYLLEHDRRVADAWGSVGIHTCSGPHVFHATLEHLPVMATECGHIPRATSGWTDVDEAQQAIGDRPIVLKIGQELPEGDEEAMLRDMIERRARNPRVVLAATGMHWSTRDHPAIVELHRRVDDYFHQRLESASLA